MSDFKEFQGKNLDEAIQAACDYYEVQRDKLEIEILSGGSTGIFGLVGVRKAAVRACPRRGVKAPAAEQAQPQEVRENASAEDKQQPVDQIPSENEKRKDARPPRQRSRRSAPDKTTEQAEQAPANVQEPQSDTVEAVHKAPAKPEQPRREPRQAQPRPKAAPVEEVDDFPPDFPDDDFPPDFPDDDNNDNNGNKSESHGGPSLEGLDKDKLEAVTLEAAKTLLGHLVPDPKITVRIETDRVQVLIEDDENSGLIIGREGQTLSALQYLVNRIVSRHMEASVRVQLDTGDYRERQDEKLRQQARRLAEKAISSRRTQSTKPLSSYHRRVVHLTVQEMRGVLTRSKGEGPLKRVLIVPKKRSR
ncbi:MAG: Jag N-terminal domain-containing protein [Desulfovibrionaceae bacterium]